MTVFSYIKKYIKVILSLFLFPSLSLFFQFVAYRQDPIGSVVTP